MRSVAALTLFTATLIQAVTADCKYEEWALVQMNKVRASSSEQLRPLQLCPSLCEAATLQSEYQAKSNDLSHDGPIGYESTGKRISLFSGTQPKFYAENVAGPTTSLQVVLDGWLKSPPHRSNIMGPAYGYMGLARVGNYWTQVFSDNCASIKRKERPVKQGKKLKPWKETTSRPKPQTPTSSKASSVHVKKPRRKTTASDVSSEYRDDNGNIRSFLDLINMFENNTNVKGTGKGKT